MSRSELIEKMAKRLNISTRAAACIVEATLENIMSILDRGESVSIRDFGSFTVRGHRAYTGRNPQTGEKTQVASKKTATFKAGKGLNELINTKKKDKKEKVKNAKGEKRVYKKLEETEELFVPLLETRESKRPVKKRTSIPA